MSNFRVLVADDNPLSLRFLIDAIGLIGIAAATADNGISAVERATAAPFDLLLLDARMPDLDGVGALACIRAGAGPSRDAIALATTADDSAEARNRLLDAGFAAVLVKPLAVDALREALATHGARAGSVSDMHAGPYGLDDRQALLATGGDRAIVDALRKLLLCELEALPMELRAMARREDSVALRDRLHRLDASAGFCGIPALACASSELRAHANAGAWPHEPLDAFLDACDACARLLATT